MCRLEGAAAEGLELDSPVGFGVGSAAFSEDPVAADDAGLSASGRFENSHMEI